jgi:signal-transduction protein with cAMP-binding, CBS, and nucleotidyltransferase domain
MVQAEHNASLEKMLEAIPRIARLPRVERQKIVGMLQFKTVREDDLVVKIGERCTAVYILEEGQLEVINASNQLVDILNGGSTFGDHALLGEKCSLVSVTAD